MDLPQLRDVGHLFLQQQVKLLLVFLQAVILALDRFNIVEKTLTKFLQGKGFRSENIYCL